MLRTLPLLALAAAIALAQGPNPVNKDLLDLAADIAAGKNVNAKVTALRKKHDDLADVMRAYKPRNRGGIGFGPVAPADSIESKVFNLGKKALTPAALAKEKNDLLKLVELNRAMAKLTEAYAPPKPNAKGNGAAQWRKRIADINKGNDDLEAAIRRGDVGGVRKAAESINATCIGCHND